MNTKNDDMFDQDFSSPNFGEEREQASMDITSLLRVSKDSPHYADFMAVNLTSTTSAVLIIKGKKYSIQFTSLLDLIHKVNIMLYSENLPKPEE